MKRRQPLRAKQAWPKPGTRKPIRARSTRRREESDERTAVRDAVLNRDGWACRGKGLTPGPCGFIGERQRLEVHELAPRSVYPGGHLDVDNCVSLCPRCHDWVTDHPGLAHHVGLHRWSWET